MRICDETSGRTRRKLVTSFFLGVVSLMAAVVLLVIDPIPIVARKYTLLSPGSYVIEFIKKPIEGVHVSVYIFNITNAEDFMSGKYHKLKMEEVGPFTYREVVHLEDFELDEVAGVMRYRPRIESVFVPEESIGHPEDINVTVPSISLLGLTSMVSSYPYLVRMAYNMLVRQQNLKAIVTLDAKSFMWGTRTPDPLMKIFKTIAPGVIPYEKIGLFDFIYEVQKKNDLVVGATEKDKFMIKTRNGCKKLMISNLLDPETCKECDVFNNTYEGMMYPSPVRPDMPIKLFKPGFCKTVEWLFHEKRVIDSGIEVLVFHVSDTFYSKGNIHGLHDLSKCIVGFPASLSKVHLQDVDPKLYERIDGMKPDPDKYNSYLMIEPITGVEVDTFGTFQVNMPLSDLTFNSETKRFSNMLVPSSYAIIKQPQLIEEISSVLKILYVTLPLLLLIARIVLFLVAFTFLMYSMRLLLRDKYTSDDMNYSCPILITKIDDKCHSVKVQDPLLPNSIK